MQIVMYNRDPNEINFTHEDVNINATFGGLNIIFLNIYVTTMMVRK